MEYCACFSSFVLRVQLWVMKNVIQFLCFLFSDGFPEMFQA